MTHCQKCKKSPGVDYRYCDDHLLRDFKVMVAPSRVSGAGLGLFAMDHRLGKDPNVQRRHNIVFRRRDKIGAFAGEIIDNSEYERRYRDTNGFAPYCLGIDNDRSHDESVLRTAFSYANDGVNLKDPLLRRNYIHRTGTHVVWHDLQWPHVINAVCELDREGGAAACLYALGDIMHGDEILWSYSGLHGCSRDETGAWVKEANGSGQIQDGYFYGYLTNRHQ